MSKSCEHSWFLQWSNADVQLWFCDSCGSMKKTLVASREPPTPQWPPAWFGWGRPNA